MNPLGIYAYGARPVSKGTSAPTGDGVNEADKPDDAAEAFTYTGRLVWKGTSTLTGEGVNDADATNDTSERLAFNMLARVAQDQVQTAQARLARIRSLNLILGIGSLNFNDPIP